MKRSETTKFLSRLLEKSRFSGPGKYWAREVSLDYGYAAGKARRVDYMQFIPENQCSISAIEKGKFAQHIRENFPECYAEIGNMGVMIAVPYQRDVAEEFESPTPLGEDVEKWRLSVILKCGHNGSRKRSMTELLFCMVRSGH